HEIARTADVVTQAAIGDIRLQWWRDALAGIFDGRAPRAHPVLAAIAEAHREAPLPRGALEALIDARGRDLDATPFATFAEIDAYLEATAGSLIRLALAACGTQLDALIVGAAARAWGYAGLLRAATHWRARGRSVLPRENADPHAMVERARVAHAAAKSGAAPADAFPAIGYVALTPLYLRAIENGRTERSLFTRQLRLVAASATGQL
ncbi:MAG: squalene/phytoene synthase family protein, partial [Proteobacteria bacterium]|nr:squalene/phytoene synthase family protein [Pseudomonadota bacterium]